MRYVLKNQEMQTVDHETIHGIGIPGLVLMERASKAVADKAAQIVDHSQRILIISGIGNNGGDALACTRILLEQDYLVDYMIVGNIEKASADLKLQLQILKNLGYFPIDCEDVNFHEYDLLFFRKKVNMLADHPIFFPLLMFFLNQFGIKQIIRVFHSKLCR